MDMSFANQALCGEYIAKNASQLERKVYDVPDDIDSEVARLKLHAMGIGIDTLTDEQRRYLSSWEEGTCTSPPARRATSPASGEGLNQQCLGPLGPRGCWAEGGRGAPA